MLQECKDHCDFLIVALNTAENIDPQINPGKNKPVYSLSERKLIMESCRYVDKVLTYSSEEELLALLKSNNINIRFLGEDYRGKPITGGTLPIELYYTNRGHGLSTSAYIRKIRSQE